MEEKRVRVKAESYIKGQVTTHGCGEIKDGTDIIEESIALKAVEMARREEREKAVKEFKALTVIAVSPTIHNERKIIKTVNELTNVFTELINK